MKSQTKKTSGARMLRWGSVPWAPAADRMRLKKASPGLVDREGVPEKPRVKCQAYVRRGQRYSVKLHSAHSSQELSHRHSRSEGGKTQCPWYVDQSNPAVAYARRWSWIDGLAAWQLGSEVRHARRGASHEVMCNGARDYSAPGFLPNACQEVVHAAL